jgi:hypothetical protein
MHVSTYPGPPGPGGAPTQQQPTPPPPPAAYPPQQYQGGYQQGGEGPGLGERASHAADAIGRHVKTPETKEFFKTSEFMIWLVVTLGILIAAAAIGGDDGTDHFLANEAWRYVTILSAAYLISRGISKAGTRRGYGDAPMDRGGRW